MSREIGTHGVWYGARLATMAENGRPYGLIEDAALVVRGERIEYAGPRAGLPPSVIATAHAAVDVEGRLVTPGLVDCHTHLVYAGNRAREFEMRLGGAGYAEIARAGGGILSTVRETRAASRETLTSASERRLRELRRSGVTTLEVKSGYGLDLETELGMLRIARELGERAAVGVRTTYLGLHAVPPEFATADDYVSFVIERVLPEIAASGLADAVDAFCENIAFDRIQTARYFRAAQELGLPVKLHADQLSDGGGAALAAEFDALSADHLEYASEDGLQRLAQSGSVAVVLPGAYYFLREGKAPPLESLRRLGIPIAVASDCNPGTSPLGSLLLALNLACVLFRMTPEEALIGATRHAARALGLLSEIGTLEPGKFADFAVWDVEEPAQLIYAAGTNPLATLVRRGLVTGEPS